MEYFYSYDLYTMYSYYAAMCGCVSIVVPVSGLTKQEWRPVHEARFGVAYGMEDKEWAEKTRQNLLDQFAQQQIRETEMVQNFVRKCEAFYHSERAHRALALEKGVIERLVGS